MIAATSPAAAECWAGTYYELYRNGAGVHDFQVNAYTTYIEKERCQADKARISSGPIDYMKTGFLEARCFRCLETNVERMHHAMETEMRQAAWYDNLVREINKRRLKKR